MEYKTYISFLSWEKRFKEGFIADCKNHKFERKYVFFFENGHNKTGQEAIKQEIKVSYPETEFLELSFNDNVSNWKTLKNIFENKANFKDVLVNVSTMPRNILYNIMHFLKQSGGKFGVIYYYAEKHCHELTQSPYPPKLVLQHSGIFEAGKPTLLVVSAGYDKKRILQLYNYFEPAVIYVFQETNHKAPAEVKEDADIDYDFIPWKNKISISSCEKYSIFKALNERITPKIKEYNILLCSLGPKISALEMFFYQEQNPETAIAYVSSKDYSPDYSCGINLEEPVYYSEDDISYMQQKNKA